MITKKYYKLIKVSHADSGYFYIKNVSNEVGEFSILNCGDSGTLEYSLDGVNWTSYDLTTKPSVNVNPNSNIYFRGTNFTNYSYSNEGGVVNFTKDYIVGGNVLSFINYTTMTTGTIIGGSIEYVFYKQTHLISAENINFGNATTIANRGQYNWFANCTSLTKIPDYSGITTVGSNSFEATFYGCHSLTTGADFSNITSVGGGSFNYCFSNCLKISSVTAPNVQNITTGMLSSWLADSAGSQATGTKVVNVPTGATITTNSTSGIPTGWTRVDY